VRERRRKERWRSNLSTSCSAPCCSCSLPPAPPGGRRTGPETLWPPHEEPAQAQDATSPESEIVTDRPDITESSIVIPTGSVQAENGLTWTAEHSKRTADAPQSLLRVGVAAAPRCGSGFPDYVYSLGQTPPRSGFRNVSVGVKQQLGPLPGAFDLSVISASPSPWSPLPIQPGVDPEVKVPCPMRSATRGQWWDVFPLLLTKGAAGI